MYKITEHTKNRLNDLNKKLNTDKINIDLSTNKNKKLDIFIQKLVLYKYGFKIWRNPRYI
jgi:hypothetical protein